MCCLATAPTEQIRRRRVVQDRRPRFLSGWNRHTATSNHTTRRRTRIAQLAPSQHAAHPAQPVQPSRCRRWARVPPANVTTSGPAVQYSPSARLTQLPGDECVPPQPASLQSSEHALVAAKMPWKRSRGLLADLWPRRAGACGEQRGGQVGCEPDAPAGRRHCCHQDLVAVILLEMSLHGSRPALAQWSGAAPGLAGAGAARVLFSR
jgi:hypothetical protein